MSARLSRSHPWRPTAADQNARNETEDGVPIRMLVRTVAMEAAVSASEFRRARPTVRGRAAGYRRFVEPRSPWGGGAMPGHVALARAVLASAAADVVGDNVYLRRAAIEFVIAADSAFAFWAGAAGYDVDQLRKGFVAFSAAQDRDPEAARQALRRALQDPIPDVLKDEERSPS